MKIVILIVVAALCCLTATNAAFSTASQQAVGFRPRWNAPTAGCKRQMPSPDTFGIVTNPQMEWFGPEMTIFYQMGLFPLLNGELDKTPCWVKHDANCSWVPWSNITVKENGGVPQRANLTAHLAKVREDVAKIIPDANYSGYVVIDWETWRVPFVENWDEHSIYQVYSERLVEAEHPTWNASAVRAAAEEEFNSAAITFWSETATTIKAMHPNAKLGFYSYPYTPHDVEALSWLWNVVDLLNPSFYVAPNGTYSWLNQTARAMGLYQIGLETQQQMYSNFSKKLTTAPYVFDGVYCCGQPVVAFNHYASVISYFLPAAMGIQDAILWGSSSTTDVPIGCKKLGQSWKAIGPTLKKCIDATAACSMSTCSGNGNCATLSMSSSSASLTEMMNHDPMKLFAHAEKLDRMVREGAVFTAQEEQAHMDLLAAELCGYSASSNKAQCVCYPGFGGSDCSVKL